MLAGRVGILDNFNFQSDYIYINTMIGMNSELLSEI